jgi:hypothetical protein
MNIVHSSYCSETVLIQHGCIPTRCNHVHSSYYVSKHDRLGLGRLQTAAVKMNTDQTDQCRPWLVHCPLTLRATTALVVLFYIVLWKLFERRHRCLLLLAGCDTKQHRSSSSIKRKQQRASEQTDNTEDN